MIKQLTHVGVVRKWCIALGVLLSTSISEDEAEIKLAAYVPLLMKEFPDAAFCEAALRHVARECKYFPTYGELIALLGEWWRDNRPPLGAYAITDEATHRTPFEEQQLRHAELMREWDNPTAIREHVEDVRSDPLMLNLLRAAVNKFAPQHAHLVPP